MENRIITISREFGSGGRTIGKLVADKLGIHCYDAELIQRIVEKSGYDADYVMKTAPEPPKCEACGGIVKPDVVLYEEALDGETMQKAAEAIARADTLIIGGTSLVVYPAAGFIRYFHGKHLVVINKTETKADRSAELVLRTPIGETMEAAMKALGE